MSLMANVKKDGCKIFSRLPSSRSSHGVERANCSVYKIVHVPSVITLELIILELFDKVLFGIHARPDKTIIVIVLFILKTVAEQESFHAEFILSGLFNH